MPSYSLSPYSQHSLINSCIYQNGMSIPWAATQDKTPALLQHRFPSLSSAPQPALAVVILSTLDRTCPFAIFLPIMFVHVWTWLAAPCSPFWLPYPDSDAARGTKGLAQGPQPCIGPMKGLTILVFRVWVMLEENAPAQHHSFLLLIWSSRPQP